MLQDVKLVELGGVAELVHNMYARRSLIEPDGVLAGYDWPDGR